MARIRTIKPEFFRNHELYAAEMESCLPLRVAFAGLWTAADREGRFKWNPQELKLDCLPYDEVDFSRVLHALSTRHYIIHYESDGREYGCIPSWNRHQAINNREIQSVLPQFIAGTEIADVSSTREPRVSETTKGKGREGKGREGKEEDTCASYSTDIPEVSDEEAHAPIPEPVQEEREPGSYPQAVFAAWEALGAHVYQPSSLWLFESKWGQHVAPYVKGIHSSDVLKALANFRSIVDAPEGTYYWTQRIGAHAFFEKHLEKFLPANFDPKDFEKRLNFKEQEEADTKAAYREVFGQEMET